MQKVKIIAEIGLNHNGSVVIAKKLIDMAKACGADMVKFQKRTIDVCYTKAMLDSPRDSPWGTTQREQKEALEFDDDQYAEIDAHCKAVGIPWFGSAWDVASLYFLEAWNPPCHKIASTMATNLDFVSEVNELRRPVLLSTGACTMDDIGAAVKALSLIGDLTLLHCVMEYPCPTERLNLAMIDTLRGIWPKVGYSGHEVGVVPSVCAVAMGATVVERHITLDRAMYGSDQSASLERNGLKKLVEYIRELEQAMGDGVKRVTPEEAKNAGKMRWWQ
jgi:N-acetylneuraminate synthase